jgi:hypothetical protein
MKNTLMILFVTFFTFSAYANLVTSTNKESPEAVNNDKIVKMVKSNLKHQGNFAILKKANLNEASLLQVAGTYPTCQQCTNDLYYCKSNATNQNQLGQCYQEYADCREICTNGNPWDNF